MKTRWGLFDIDLAVAARLFLTVSARDGGSVLAVDSATFRVRPACGLLRCRCLYRRSHGQFCESMCTHSYFIMWGVQAWTSRALRHMEGSH